MHPRGTTTAPASPHTTRVGGADQEGHPTRVKPRGAAGKRKNEGVKTTYTNIYLIYNNLYVVI